MEVTNVEQIAFLVFNPAFFGKSLAFRAVPVTTGVVRIPSMPATVTNIFMTT